MDSMDTTGADNTGSLPDSPLSILSSPPKFSNYATFESPNRDTASEASPNNLVLPADRMMRGEPPSPSPDPDRPSKRIKLIYHPASFARKFAHLAPRAVGSQASGPTNIPSAINTPGPASQLGSFRSPTPVRRRGPRSTGQPLQAPAADTPLFCTPPSAHVASLMPHARDAQDAPEGSPIRTSPTATSNNMSLISPTELTELCRHNDVLRKENLTFSQTNSTLANRIAELEAKLQASVTGLERVRAASSIGMATTSSSLAAQGGYGHAHGYGHQNTFSSQMTDMAMNTLEEELATTKKELETAVAERLVYWEGNVEFARLERLASAELLLTKQHVVRLMSRVTRLEQDVNNANRAKQVQTLELSRVKAMLGERELGLLYQQQLQPQSAGGGQMGMGLFGTSGGGMPMRNNNSRADNGGQGQSGYPDLGNASGMN